MDSSVTSTDTEMAKLCFQQNKDLETKKKERIAWKAAAFTKRLNAKAAPGCKLQAKEKWENKERMSG